MRLGSVWLAIALGTLGASGVQAQESDSCGGDVDEETFGTFSRAVQVEKMTCWQAAATASVQDQLPHQVDEVTSVTSVTSNGTIVTYINTVDVAPEDIPEGAVPAIISSTRETVCADDDMTAVIRMGGGYRYIWKLTNGDTLAETTIESCS